MSQDQNQDNVLENERAAAENPAEETAERSPDTQTNTGQVAEPAVNEGEQTAKAAAPKHSIATYVIMLVFIMIAFEIICFPLLMLAIDGPDMTRLTESDVEPVPLTLENYWNGEFQEKFEGWFNMHYPLRSDIVTTYKTMTIRYDSFLSASPSEEDDPVEQMTESGGGVIALETDDQGHIVFPQIGTETAAGHGTSESGLETNPGNPGEDESSTTGPDIEVETTLMDWYLDYNNNKYALINSWFLNQKKEEPTAYKGTSAVLVGKTGYLYERAYIDEYMGYSEPYTSYSASDLQLTVKNLEYIQDQLAKQGIGFCFVISSSKASQCADFIPEWYKNTHTAKPGYVRAYDTLMPMLESSHLNFVDAKTAFEEAGLLNTFPKTGIHWNDIASFETMVRAVSKLEETTNTTTRHMVAKTIYASESVTSGIGNSEQDIYNIMWNATDPSLKYLAVTDRYYYSPDITVENPGAPAKNVLIQGGSFCHDIVYYVNNYIGRARQIYYNWSSFGDFTGSGMSFHNPLTDGDDCWDTILEGIDYVIFEATEQQLATIAWNSSGHAVMYRSLYNYLKSTE